MKKFCFTSKLFLLFVTFFYSQINGSFAEPHLYRAILTTDLNSDSRPINSVSSVNFSEKIYIYHYWTDLTPDQEYECRVKFYDGSGQLVDDDSMTFSSDSVSHHTWFRYRPLANVDKKGRWKIEVFLDEKSMLTRYLTVKSPTSWDQLKFSPWHIAFLISIALIILLILAIVFWRKFISAKRHVSTPAPPVLPH